MKREARYEASMRVDEARRRYFELNGFGDGGYADEWVKLKIAGVIPIAFPNSDARRKAVRLHDLHHVATGYDTTWTGEAEIGAWELAAGCGRYYAAWVLNFGAMCIGFLIAPRRVLRAIDRGMKSKTLYDVEFSDALLAMSVGELRAKLRLNS